MSDNTQQPSGGQEPRDPWAPPEHKVPLDKPPVHDQQTVVSMPGADGRSAAPAQGPFPGAPGQQVPGQQAPAPGFGGPTPQPAPPGQAVPGSYGYPSYPQQPAQGYPGYPGAGQQPAYGYPGWTGMPAPQNGFGIAAMVLGIAACVLMFCSVGIAGIVLGTLALIFGLLGKNRVGRGEANNRGQALTGIIMGIIGIVLGIGLLVLVIVTSSYEHSSYNDYSNFLSLAVSAR
ncbi:hypothetical protein ACIBCO_19915 [Streptomyces violascens]|uniref:hypothetical protein n=1 Tax=Streptomyces violascens TaxID=67381 RepID=UPI003790CEAA